MKHALFQEIVVPLALVALLAVLANPLGLWMPDALSMALVLALTALGMVFAAFVWKERARDERERLHTLLADRAGFLAGAGLLLAGVVFGTLRHDLNLWLAAALASMILAKSVGHWYGRARH